MGQSPRYSRRRFLITTDRRVTVTKNRAFALLQECVPQHLLSRLIGKIADCKIGWIKNTFIKTFARAYDVNMSEASEENLEAYPSFNAFFTRALKPSARPISPDPAMLVCPADGGVSQLGQIEQGRIFQAKGHDYTLEALLAGNERLSKEFDNGNFATIYLSPKDYHRVHMPIDGKLREMIYVPGELFSVNTATTEEIPGLFARNERLVCIFDTAVGPMAMILVGAMIVAGIETCWSGQEAPPARKIKHTNYDQTPAPTVLVKGEEMGRFKLGSTVILLFAEDAINWLEDYRAGTTTRLGEPLAVIND